MKKPIKNIQASIQAKLQNTASKTGRPFSEKIEAIIKLGALNSRMKDYYDLWLMLRQFDFDGDRLSEAIKRTFHHRQTALPEGKAIFAEEIYDEKSDRQTLWKAFLKKGDIKHAPNKLSEIAQEIEKFLVDPFAAVRKGQEFSKQWKAPGLWRNKHGV